MKKILISITILLLLYTSTLPVNIQANPQIIIKNEKLIDFIKNQKFKLFKTNSPKTSSFNPVDIELKDDAFHGSNSLNFAEWWYFDAMLDKNYSAQMTIYVFGVFTKKYIISEANIYKNGINVLSRQKYFIFNELDLSKETPNIKIDGQQLMKGYIDEITGLWIYDVKLNFTDASLDLQFIGKSKGWKGILSIGGWACILPKAEVKGKIRLNDIEYNVEGEGYHDHNWDMTLFDLLHFGWYWGKVNSDNMTIIWFMILNTRFISDNLCVISKDDGEYVNIDSEDIDFNAKNYDFDYIWLIPKSFILRVDTKNIYFSILMNTETIDSDFKVNGHYWRYHINYSGNIIINDDMEFISGIQIVEFMRFR